MCAGLPEGALCLFQGNVSNGFVFARLKEGELKDMLERHPGKAEYVEPDARVMHIPVTESSTSETPTLTQSRPPWGLDRIDDESLPLDYSYLGDAADGSGVHVYVFDSGIRTTHSDFGNRAISTLDMSQGYARECQGSTNCAVDTVGHGTHCAATIAGSTYGVAKGAQVHAVKICPGSSCGPWSWSIYAFQWIARNGHSNAVASMSVGGQGNSPSLTSAIGTAVSQGITVVVAAGNSGTNACGFTPAGIPAAITVGGTDRYDNFYWQHPGSQSNYGSCVDILAPAVDIVSATHVNDYGSATMTGTSMACPHVSGAAALLKKTYPNPTSRLVSQAVSNKIRGSLYGSPNKLLFVGRDL
jgi:subtilisin family serine protease